MSIPSVQWVCPRQSSTSDIVLDAAQSSATQLVGVGRGGDVRWWKVREEEEEGEGGGEGGGLGCSQEGRAQQSNSFVYVKKLWFIA